MQTENLISWSKSVTFQSEDSTKELHVPEKKDNVDHIEDRKSSAFILVGDLTKHIWVTELNH